MTFAMYFVRYCEQRHALHVRANHWAMHRTAVLVATFFFVAVVVGFFPFILFSLEKADFFFFFPSCHTFFHFLSFFFFFPFFAVYTQSFIKTVYVANYQLDVST